MLNAFMIIRAKTIQVQHYEINYRPDLGLTSFPNSVPHLFCFSLGSKSQYGIPHRIYNFFFSFPNQWHS